MWFPLASQSNNLLEYLIKEIASENVLKHIKKVDSLEVIRRKVMKEPTINSRIYYTLSPLDIFYVISN